MNPDLFETAYIFSRIGVRLHETCESAHQNCNFSVSLKPLSRVVKDSIYRCAGLKKKDLKNVRIRVDGALFSSKRSELSTARERVNEQQIRGKGVQIPTKTQDWDYDSLYYNM